MKKILSLALSAALLCSLGVPAFAAETGSADARLAAVTQAVKVQLELDTAIYTDFHGDLNERAATPVWDLQWSGSEVSLSVTATESGKILSYHLDQDNTATPAQRPSFGAAFPKLTRTDAAKTAQAFLDKVMAPGVESAAMDKDDAVGRLSTDSHSFTGDILEHGLPSPFGFRITVRVRDNVVTSYYNTGDVTQFMGAVPSAIPAADAAKAGEALKGTLKLKLEYVLDEDGKTAVLRYLPENTDEFYVDGQSGKLVNLTELYAAARKSDANYGGTAGAEPSAPPEVAMKETLTQAEQEGVAKLEGVLSKEALDAAARKMTALGLGKYTLSGTSYTLDAESGDVTARLQYARKTGDLVYRRYVSVDGKTAALKAVSSSAPWDEKGQSNYSVASAQTKAEAFLKEICPAEVGKSALYNTPEAAGKYRNAIDFTYAQKENGYFFPGNSISVGVDAADGSISHYSKRFDTAVTLESAEGIIGDAAALSAWFGTYAVTLNYLGVPQKLDLSAPEWRPFIDMGYSYLYVQTLAYNLTRDGWYQGIAAKTGDPVLGESDQQTAITYDDLEGHWMKKQAEQLAAYGVGWLGGSMKPAEALTQRDALALLVSTGGYRYDPAEDADADQLYSIAYSMGILTKAQRSDAAPVTRSELVKLLLDSAGYGNIAGLEGIFKCSFTDQAAIPAADYGYAAVAQGLGIVKGDKAGNFAPGRIATRAEAASMVYQYMSR